MDATLASIVASVITAFLTGLLTYLGVRSRARVDVQASLNAGFNLLVSELQEERADLKRERIELRNEIQKQDAEILELKKKLERLLSVTTSFHNFIVTNGLVPPPFNPEDVDLGSNSDA